MSEVDRLPVIERCRCGHEESDGRSDVLACPVHGFEARTQEALRVAAEVSEVESLRRQLRGAVGALNELRVILDDTEAYGDAIEQLRALRMRLITAPTGGQ